jgi:RNA recognition motif-containing protein
MSQQYQEMYQDYSSSRSPGTGRAYAGLTLNRQTSRQFDYGNGTLSGLYTAEDHAQRYDPAARFDRVASSTLPSGYPYDAQTWSFGGANPVLGGQGGTARPKPQNRSRLPAVSFSSLRNLRGCAFPTDHLQPWMEQMAPPMPPLPSMHQMNGYAAPGQLQQPRGSPPMESEELIPTAIVIKNIPFAVKKEQLVAIMTDMHLPLPYAFNYHFDNGVFRGLAFANFTTPEETQQVIDVMNHLELQGRKLRVEYKKMLPAAERDRIERDKRERRGQLQEQHQPMNTSQLRNQNSVNSLNSNIPATSPSPISQRPGSKLGWYHLVNCPQYLLTNTDIDLNDPTTLSFYTELMLFKGDANRETLIFPTTITPEQRRTIHTLAHHMGLEHRSEGQAEMRQVQILKNRPTQISPPVPQLQSSFFNESQRRGLNRAATIDFSESRDPSYYNHTLGRQTSGLLDIPGSPGMTGLQNLRAAKSFADLRSYTPSPAPSTASFPAGAAQNLPRYADNYGQGHATTAASGTPNITPTSAGGLNSSSSRDNDFVLNGIAGLNLGFNTGVPRGNAAGPIGSRPVNGNYEETSRNGTTTAPERQPRGPGSEWAPGFSRPRQNGHVNRSSAELDINSGEGSWENRG